MSRIAFLHGSNDLYGASRVLIDDARTLRAAGHEIAVVLPADGPLTQSLKSEGARVSIEPLRVLRKVASPREMLPPGGLPRHAAEADVVVTWTLALSAYLPVLRARRKKVIASVHEILEGRAGTVLARATGLLAPALMSNSQTTSRWLASSGVSREKVMLAYPQAPPYAPLPRRNTDAPTVALLLAGRVNGHKGHLEAVEAVKRVRARGVDAELLLLGGSYPGQEHHLEALLRAVDGADGIRYAGEVPNVTPFMADIDAMLVPTTRPEPFGVVALEAWAAGRRVIASDEGGLAEATRMVDGISVPARDIDALAAAIERVAAEPSLRAEPSATAEVSQVCTANARLLAWERALHSVDI